MSGERQGWRAKIKEGRIPACSDSLWTHLFFSSLFFLSLSLSFFSFFFLRFYLLI